MLRKTGVALLLMLLMRPAHSAVWQVTANADLTFTPSDITIRAGDAIVFTNGGGVHNVHADNNRFRCAINCSTNASPSGVLWSVTVQFNLAGDFGYYCDQHGDLVSGMRGRVRVLENIYTDGFEAAIGFDASAGAP